MSELDDIRKRVKKEGVCGTPVFDDILRIATEQEARIAELEEQRDTWQRIFNASEAELTQLRTERERYKMALEDIEEYTSSSPIHMGKWVYERAHAELTQVRTERDSWKGMYMLCNEREQKLSKIKELAEKFIRAYENSHCWIENGVEDVSVYLDDLTAALTQREGGDDE